MSADSLLPRRAAASALNRDLASMVMSFLGTADLVAPSMVSRDWLDAAHDAVPAAAAREFDVGGWPRDRSAALKARAWLLAAAVRSAGRGSLLVRAMTASSSDPEGGQGPERTLTDDRACPHDWWSSAGSPSPAARESVVFSMLAPVSLVAAFTLRPVQADYQDGEPVYSPARARVVVCDQLRGAAPARNAPVFCTPWFGVRAADEEQRFELAQPAVARGRFAVLELDGKPARQDDDGLHYVCLRSVAVEGWALRRFAADGDGVAEPLPRPLSGPGRRWAVARAARLSEEDSGARDASLVPVRPAAGAGALFGVADRCGCVALPHLPAARP